MTRAVRHHGLRAALLLEVVVALSIMVTTMGVLSAQLVGGMRMTESAAELTEAAQLADRILALIELDPNTVERFFDQKEIDGDFASDVYEQYRGWYWRATVWEFPDNDELGRLTIEILHAREPGSKGSIDDARVVRTLQMLKANPGRIDLAKDFGVPPEQVDTLLALLPIPGLDPTALDPLALVSLDPETLAELLPIVLPLLQMFGGGKLPGDLSPDMLNSLLSGNILGGSVEGALPGAGTDPAVADMLRTALGGNLSEEELNSLLSGVGGAARGTGDAGGAAPGGGIAPPPSGGTGGRSGRTIEDLSRERGEKNRKLSDRNGGGR